MVILDLWGMVFHAMVVIAPIYILLLESIWACCAVHYSCLDYFDEHVINKSKSS